MENASRKYTYDQVKEMISQKQALGWEFLFLGANIDAAKEAARFGIRADRAADYHADTLGTALNYEVLNQAVCTVRACQPLDASWKKDIDADYRKRRSNR